VSEFREIIDVFIKIVSLLREGRLTLNSPLEEIVIKAGGENLAYIDNRRDAKEKYGFDFWHKIRSQFDNEENFLKFIQSKGVNKQLLYSKSEQFPDFIFKVEKQENKLISGTLLELKDPMGGSIASFNSTLPTKFKTLEEVDIINGNNLVSRISSLIDCQLSSHKDYLTFQRRCFYLIRTHKNEEDKVKISLVDGSFFETVPKDHIIYQMFLNILRSHLEKKNISIPPELLSEIEKYLSYITDQTIIASSQTIKRASIRPRLRIMAEVHTEGNPHSSFYPKIKEKSVNLVFKAFQGQDEILEGISKRIKGVDIFEIQHRRNGEHIVASVKF